jgi:ribonuclease P protein component
MKIFSFNKKERLCGKNNIARLFEAGTVFIAYPFRVVYLFEKQEDTTKEAEVKVLISVPKKRHRRANIRNRLKRLTKESYRLNKHDFVNFAKENTLNVSVVFQYISDEILKFNIIQNKIQEILIKLKLNIENKQ